MPKKPSGKQQDAGAKITIDMLAGMMKNSFDHLDAKLDQMNVDMHEIENRLTDRLDKIEFRLTGQDQRISILEDKVRQLATKTGLQFAA